jgi:hypothetical protein
VCDAIPGQFGNAEQTGHAINIDEHPELFKTRHQVSTNVANIHQGKITLRKVLTTPILVGPAKHRWHSRAGIIRDAT